MWNLAGPLAKPDSKAVVKAGLSVLGFYAGVFPTLHPLQLSPFLMMLSVLFSAYTVCVCESERKLKTEIERENECLGVFPPECLLSLTLHLQKC